MGVLAAYYPKLDNIIMRCMDLFMAIPQMLLAMCIVTALGSSLFNLMLAVGRRYGRADYLPVIAWGRLASRAGVCRGGPSHRRQ